MATQSEDYRKLLLELEDYAILLLDKNGTVKEWNLGAQKLKGYSAEEIIGKSFKLFYCDEDRANRLPEKLLERAKSEGKASDEGWRVKKDGSMFWGSILITASHDDKRNVTGFLKITRDLTDKKIKEHYIQKQNELLEKEIRQKTEVLEASEIKYRKTLDNMLEGVHIIDFNWIYTYVNDTVVKRRNSSREELIGKTLFEEYPGIEKLDLFKVLERCMVERTPERLKTEFVVPDGTRSYFELSIQPVPEGIFILSVDITKRKAAEEKIKETELKYKTVLETMHESLLIEDQEGKLIFANEEFTKMFGFSAQEFDKLNLKDYTAEESYAEIWERHNKRLSGQTVENEFTYKGRRKDGTEIWIEARVSALIENEKVIGTLSLERDITDRVQAKEKLKRKTRLLSFLSAINQSIVHEKEEQKLFDRVCNIAQEIGKFKSAFIAVLVDGERLEFKSLKAEQEVAKKISKIFTLGMNSVLLKNSPSAQALSTGKCVVNNDLLNDPALEAFKEQFALQSIRSSISLPLCLFGNVIGIIGFHADVKDFFDDEEISLLEEAASEISFFLENFEKEKKHKLAEELVINSEKRYRETLDNMLEGAQIIGYDWRYLYVNSALTNYSNYPGDKMIGHQMMELYPGIDKSPLFTALKRCMEKRITIQMENEFVYPNGTKRDFELSIQPVPEGIFVLSVDITDRKKALEKVAKKTRLYSFLSSINQSIVHIKSENELLESVVEIAREIGEFKSAYAGILNPDGKLEIRSIHAEAPVAEIIRKISGMDLNDPLMKNIAWVSALKSGKYTFNNDMQNDPALAHLKEIFVQYGVQSSISLPLTMFGQVIGLLAFHSSSKDFFDDDEIALLVEAASDISFALENYEKTKRHEQTELLVEQNEKRFRGLIEKSSDMITLTNKEGKISYASPSLSQTFGVSSEEIIGQSAMSFFHPEDAPQLIEKRNSILQKPGAHYDFTLRLKHKNGSWIWCEGTVINYLYDPAIEGLVTNFRDITQRRQLELQREFDKNNLHALINNTKDLMWSVDRFFQLITSNKPFDELIQATIKRPLAKGEKLITEEFGNETVNFFKKYYERAFQGEAFTEITRSESSKDFWSEVSFYPIKKENEIIGTACFSRDISESIRSAAEKQAFINQLTQNNKDLRQFAYITSHNLRGPVANLLGLTNLLENYDLHDPDLNKILKGIKTSSLLFDETIRDLATILTIKDNPSTKVENIKFADVFEKVKLLYDNSLKESGSQVVCDFTAASQVEFNKSYLESVFTNLLSNAIKYRDFQRFLKIEVSTRVENEQIILSFADNGIGFDSEAQRDKIFQLYQRFHMHKEGKGLGLFIIKSQIEALGGTIHVVSAPDKGTVFTIKFSRTE
ncbi:hypothetical protein CNR22_22855 [Sphingobacteriaceae bacterium]|nr:hypothetical protein CNR22_22855 [Sphingobacteriaceae bacterium]